MGYSKFFLFGAIPGTLFFILINMTFSHGTVFEQSLAGYEVHPQGSRTGFNTTTTFYLGNTVSPGRWEWAIVRRQLNLTGMAKGLLGVPTIL